MAFVKRRRSFSFNIEVENLDDGLLVRQGSEAYVARNWQLTPATEELIEAAIEAGLPCVIQHDHPRRNSRWPNTRGVVYLSFAPTSDKQWSVAIDSFRPSRGDYGVAVFNGKYQEQFVRHGIPFRFEGRNPKSGHLVVSRGNVISTIEALATFDHSVLALNRVQHNGQGFTTEYVLQRQILTKWQQTPWAERYDVFSDEFPVDGGFTSRRIDILARDRLTGDWLIIELKRAEATASAVHQVVDYLLALGKQDDFAAGRLKGVLVAERVPTTVRFAAEKEGVEVYEARWPISLVKVA